MILNFFFRKKDVTESTEEDVLSLFQTTGDPHYCGLIYKEFSHLISSLCFKYMKTEVEAEDAAAEIFEVLLRDLPTTSVQNLSNWIFTITKNHCLKSLRKSRSAQGFEELTEKNEHSFVEFHAEVDLSNEDELETQLDGLELSFQQLPDHQRKCLDLFYLKDKSYKDIELETDFTMKEIKSHIQNGKRRLKIILQST